MNYALIFAGGTGQRMNTKTRPKQFLELYGKPIILYTIEAFENHPAIDGIVVVCLKDWISFLKKKIAHYDITKVVDVIPGGATGQESIRQRPGRHWRRPWGATMPCSSTTGCALW